MSSQLPKVGAPKYLLVEAENPLREEFIDLLESYDAVVYIAKDQAEALKYLENENIDLMIVAALSPLEKTPDFLNEVRRQDNSKNVPLLLISNYYHSPLYAEMADQFTKAKYLVRPFHQLELLRTIKSFN